MIRSRLILLSLKEYFGPGSITLLSVVRHSISGTGLKCELGYIIYIFHSILKISLQDIYTFVDLCYENRSVCFVLDQFDFYSASSLKKQQSMGRHVAPLLILSPQVIALTP